MAFMNVPNTPEGLEIIKNLKTMLPLKVRGRGPRKTIFAKTGRTYIPNRGNANDFGLKSPEAQYATHWGVYIDDTRLKSKYGIEYDWETKKYRRVTA